MRRLQVQSHDLGAKLREMYFTSGSPSIIKDMSTELVDNKEIRVRFWLQSL